VTIETKTGVVIFLDALGVSHYNTTEEFVDFVKKLKELKISTDYVWKKWQKQFDDEDIILPDPEIVTFQDTIIICFPEPSSPRATLHYFFVAGQWLTQALGLAIEKKIFFRGAISVGEYILETSPGNVTVMGKPISDAYNFEKIADWIGVIQTPTFQKQYEDVLETLAKSRKLSKTDLIEEYRFLFSPYQVPLKEDNTHEFFVVSWPQLVFHHKEEMDLLATILSDTSLLVDPKHKPKYDNTLVFLRNFKGK
jgi:hypothetical protein